MQNLSSNPELIKELKQKIDESEVLSKNKELAEIALLSDFEKEITLSDLREIQILAYEKLAVPTKDIEEGALFNALVSNLRILTFLKLQVL